MNTNQKIELKTLINDCLDKAEKHWEGAEEEMLLASFESMDGIDEMYKSNAETQPSQLPNNPYVDESVTKVDDFIALVADMRDSTEHLNQAISGRTAKVSQLERVYYETSALLPALAKTIQFGEGSVTEYLGDGVLGFFEVDKNNLHKSYYRAKTAGSEIIRDMRDILNEIINERYSLPPINIGVGIAVSPAIVGLVGLEGMKHPKAFGKCVFEATKLSSGHNEVVMSEFMNKSWPTTKNGTWSPKRYKVKEMDCFLLDQILELKSA
ncbi:hypothetical protein [Shewanella colwelliana]|uniref:hypothetical protein n=1 Tax=Shewanella colwelliana TaxID=23 RepID=UPI003735AD9D